MKAENMIDAIGHLDEQLLAESLPAKRRNFRPLVVVAAVAAALAVTAGAGRYLLSGWQFTDDGWVDGEQYLEETMKRYPNLDPEEVADRAERYDGTYAFTMKNSEAVLHLEQSALDRLYEFTGKGKEQLALTEFASLEDLEEVLGVRFLRSDLEPTKADVKLQTYQLYSSTKRYEDTGYRIDGKYVVNAIPYGFQVSVYSTYRDPEHPGIGVLLDRQFFTVEGHAVTYNNNMNGEPKFFTVEMGDYIVDCAVGEEDAVGYFLHDGVAHNLCIWDLGERQVNQAELEEVLLKALENLY